MARLPAKSLLIAVALVAGSGTVRAAENGSGLSGMLAAIFRPAQSAKIDPRLIDASRIAEQRAHRRTTWRCWRYVKDALLAADVIDRRPGSAWAKHAGDELAGQFGFVRLPSNNPYAAPVGAVIVYGGRDAGHVEFRTSRGFASDFVSPTPYPRPVIGVYVKRA